MCALPAPGGPNTRQGEGAGLGALPKQTPAPVADSQKGTLNAKPAFGESKPGLELSPNAIL